MRFKILSIAFSFFILLSSYGEDSKGYLNVGMVYDFTSLDPVLVQTSDDFEYSLQLHEGLTSQNPRTFELLPGSAQKWERSPDGYQYTFFLRKNLKWSDGTPITSEDFKYSWLRALKPDTGSGYTSLLFAIKNGEAFNRGTAAESEVGIETPDPYTLKVTLQQPIVYFINLTSLPIMAPVPRHKIKNNEQKWADAENIVVNGPFYVESIDRENSVLTLKKNPNYWDVESVRLPGVKFHFNLEHDRAFTMYVKGQLDINHHTTWEDILQFVNHDEAHRYPLLGTFFLRLNTTHPILSDKRIRKALYLTVNRNIICREILKGGEFPTYSLIPKRIPNYTNILGERENPVKARELLAEAGYPGGKGFPGITISYNNFSNNNIVARAVAADWKRELNITVEFDQIDSHSQFIKKVKNLDYEVARSSWIGDYLDPSTFFDIFETPDGGNNRTGWKHEEYTHLIQLARREIDPQKRTELYNQAEAILIDEAPIIPLYHYVNMFLKKSYVKGVYPSLQDIIPLKKVYIER